MLIKALADSLLEDDVEGAPASHFMLGLDSICTPPPLPCPCAGFLTAYDNAARGGHIIPARLEAIKDAVRDVVRRTHTRTAARTHMHTAPRARSLLDPVNVHRHTYTITHTQSQSHPLSCIDYLHS